MKLLIFFIFLLLFSTASFGNLKQLADEFLHSNINVYKAQQNVEKGIYDFKGLIKKRPFSVGLSSYYYKSDLEKVSPIMGGDTENNVYTLFLSKDFIWGGNFTLSNELTKILPPSYGLREDRSQFKQNLGFKLDLGPNFFGRISRMDERSGEINLILTKTVSENIVENNLLIFFKVYLETSLNKTLLDLQLEAWDRAFKRKKLIMKRVRDGLREKVDLYLAKMEERTQDENVNLRRVNLIGSINNLSNLLHRDISGKEIEGIKFLLNGNNSFFKVPSGTWESGNDKKVLDKKMDLVNNSFKTADLKVMPTITFEANYSTNKLEDKAIDSFSSGNLGSSDNNEFKVGVTLSMPIGFHLQKFARSKGAIDKMIIEAEKNKMEKNFYESEKSLKGQIVLMNKNIDSMKIKVALSRKVLNEYNKLYNLGRADLDQVLKAEEGLINTERSNADFLVKREIKILELATLYGRLKDYL